MRRRTLSTHPYTTFDHNSAFLSPMRIALVLVPLAIVGLGSAVLLFLPLSVQLLGLFYSCAIVCALLGANLYFDIKAARSSGPKYMPWQPTVEAPLPHICGKYVMVVEGDGTIRSALRWQGEEIQPVSSIAFNPSGDGHSSDQHGFINPTGQWSNEGVHVLAIGDSFAAGAQVKRGQGFVDLIRQKKGRTINLGCPWNGPLLELASLVEYGSIARPNLILWFFYEGNDLPDLETERHAPLLMEYLQTGFNQRLVEKRAVLDGLLTEFAETRIESRARTGASHPRSLAYVVNGDLRQNPHAIHWDRLLSLQRLRWSWGLIDLGQNRSTFNLLRRILKRADETARSLNSAFWFVYLPAKARFVGRFARIEADAYRRQVLSVVRELGISTIDVTPEFGRHPNPRSLFDGHYSPSGNQLVADFTLRRITATSSED